jgi:formate dehydrogenase subunit gamma
MASEVKSGWVGDWVARNGGGRDRLLPLLHAIQKEIGYIDDARVPEIAAALNLSRAEVHGVLTFYHDFRRKPAGRHVVKLCRAESCQARGGLAIEAAAARRLGVAMGETRRDGQLSLEPVYCLGLCAVGPNALVDGRPVARIDETAIERIAGEVSA